MKINIVNIIALLCFSFLIFCGLSGILQISNKNNKLFEFIFIYICIIDLVLFLSLIMLSLIGHKFGKYISKCCCEMGWHEISEIEYIDGDPFKFQQKSKCKHCGYEGLIDSQGNLF